MTALGCVTGRFQPVHGQHLDLFGIALDSCRHLVVAVTNPDAAARRTEPESAHRHTPAANPFSYFERARLLDAAIAERGWRDRTTIVPFDLTRPEHWTDYVPHTAVQFVRVFGAWEREKAAWLARAGYPVTVLDGDATTRVTAGAIRDSLRKGDARWRTLAPPATVPLLEAFVDQTAMRDRL